MVNKSYDQRALTFFNIHSMLLNGKTFKEITQQCHCSNSTVRKVAFERIEYEEGDELIYNVNGKKISSRALLLFYESQKIRTLLSRNAKIYNTTNLGFIWNELLESCSDTVNWKIINPITIEVRGFSLYNFLRHDNHLFYQGEKD